MEKRIKATGTFTRQNQCGCRHVYVLNMSAFYICCIYPGALQTRYDHGSNHHEPLLDLESLWCSGLTSLSDEAFSIPSPYDLSCWWDVKHIGSIVAQW